jgi:hypothetical protein
MNAFQAKRFPELLDRIALDLFEDYAGAVSDSLQARIEASQSALGTKLRDLRKELKESRRVLNRLTDLAASAEHARGMVEELSSRYSETDPHDLSQPIESDALIGLPFKEIIPQVAAAKLPIEASKPEVEREILLEDAD